MANNRYGRGYGQSYGYSYGSGNNPYNTSVFTEVRPTYVGPPVEEIAAAREELTQTAKDNQLATSMLNEAFSDSIANMQGDPEGVAMIMEHRDQFANSLSNITNEKNIAYVGPTIQKYVNNFAKDYRIKGRQKLVDEYNTYTQSIRDNKELPPLTKKAMLENMSLDKFVAVRDDKNGLYDMGELPQFYERVDVNAELLKAAGSLLNFPEITSWSDVTFLDANGKKVKYYDPNGRVAIRSKESGVTKEIKAWELRDEFKSIIRNNDALAGYLIQESLVGDWYRDNTKNPVERMKELYTNPQLLENVINKAGSNLANVLQYNQRVIDNDISALNLYNGREGGGDNNYMSGARQYHAATENQARNASRQQINDNLNNYETTLKTLFDDEEVSDNFNKSIASNNIAKAVDIAMVEGLDEDNIQDRIIQSTQLQLSQAIANSKIDNSGETSKRLNGLDKVFPNPNGKTEVDQIGDTDLAALTELGYNYQDYKKQLHYDKLSNEYIESPMGNTDLDYLMNMTNSIISRKNQLKGIIEDAEETKGYRKDPNQIAVLQKVIDDSTNELNSLIHPSELAVNINKKYGKKYKKYKEQVDDIIERPDVAIDEISQNLNPDSDLYKLLKHSFSNSATLNDMVVYETNNPHEQFKLQKGESIVSIGTIGTSPVKVGNTESGSWIFSVKLKVAGDSGSERNVVLRTPIEAGAGGITPDIMSEVVNDPMYISSKMLHEALVSNIDGTFEFPDYPGFTVTRNTEPKNETIKLATPGKKDVSSQTFLEKLTETRRIKTLQGLAFDYNGLPKYDEMAMALTALENNIENGTVMPAPFIIEDTVANVLYEKNFAEISNTEKMIVSLIKRNL